MLNVISVHIILLFGYLCLEQNLNHVYKCNWACACSGTSCEPEYLYQWCHNSIYRNEIRHCSSTI